MVVTGEVISISSFLSLAPVMYWNNLLNMPSPVTTMRQKYYKGEIHEQCFYVYLEKPPKPTDEAVYLVKREAMNVYTRTVMKRMSEKDWLKESETMDKLIDSQKLETKKNVWYSA